MLASIRSDVTNDSSKNSQVLLKYVDKVLNENELFVSLFYSRNRIYYYILQTWFIQCFCINQQIY